MFKLSKEDLDKISIGISYLMDNNSPLHLNEGSFQNFLRLEMAETDENGRPAISFSGVEFNLDNNVSDEIFITDGIKLVSKMKLLEEVNINKVETNDGRVEIEVSDNDNFTFNVGLSDPETTFMMYGDNQDFISIHKNFLKKGLTSIFKQKNYTVTEIFLSSNDLDKIKKFNSANSDSVNISIKDGRVIVTNIDKNNNDRYKFIIQENVLSEDIECNIPTNRLTKIHKSDYVIKIYHNNNDVKGFTMSSVDNTFTYILPLY